MFLQLHLHIFRNVIQSTYISKCDLQFCKSRQCFVLKQVQYYKYCFCIFILSFLIFWGQGFVEVPQLLKSVSSFTYRIVNRILRFVSRYVSNHGIVYRYTPTCGQLMPYPWRCPSSVLHRESPVVGRVSSVSTITTRNN